MRSIDHRHQRREEHRRARRGQPGEVEQGAFRLACLPLLHADGVARRPARAASGSAMLVVGREVADDRRTGPGPASAVPGSPSAAPGRSASGRPTSARTASRPGLTLPAVSGLVSSSVGAAASPSRACGLRGVRIVRRQRPSAAAGAGGGAGSASKWHSFLRLPERAGRSPSRPARRCRRRCRSSARGRRRRSSRGMVAKKYWKTANEPPATSSAGQTSSVCLQVHMHLTMYSGTISDRNGN